jgi:DNA-binding response OmpR family regulator
MSKTILIVDDEMEIAELLAMGFENYGFTPECAFSVDEAEAKIAAKNYDIILSDIRMPKKDGVELLKWIRGRDAQKPVVLMMTGYSQYNEDQIKGWGGHSLIPKPLALDHVIAIINKATGA